MSSSQEEKEIIECPICYDEIDVLKNCVTTECGHQFHCKCLMQNSATNGFSCPMCRSVMAIELEESESEADEYEDYEEDEIGEIDDNALTSFRMFHQQIDGDEVEEEEEEEDEQEQQQGPNEVEEEEAPIIKPTAEFIAAKLLAQGVTMEDLVKCLLIEHDEYDTEEETNDRCSDQMFGKFRVIISNYPREMQRQEQRQSMPGLVQRQSMPGLVQRQEQRHEPETRLGSLRNRYVIWSDTEEDDA